MTLARPYGPSRPHREPARAEPVAFSDLCAPADTYAARRILAAALEVEP